jgi:hypothetical protein
METELLKYKCLMMKKIEKRNSGNIVKKIIENDE